MAPSLGTAAALSFRAPVGRTPVVQATGARFSVNMISAISAKGALRFSIIDGTLTAAKFINFCKRLLRDNDGPVFLILDGHPVHRSKAVTAFADSACGPCSASPPTRRNGRQHPARAPGVVAIRRSGKPGHLATESDPSRSCR